MIVPDSWFAVAAALLNVTLPRSWSTGRPRRRRSPVQAVGASAIHSAEETSRGCESGHRRRERVLLVGVLDAHRHLRSVDEHSRDDSIPSPNLQRHFGRSPPERSPTRRTSSATPRLLHCAVVPICWSVDESSLKPPIPTQKAAASARPLTQCAFGCVQLPVTSPKVRGESADGAASGRSGDCRISRTSSRSPAATCQRRRAERMSTSSRSRRRRRVRRRAPGTRSQRGTRQSGRLHSDLLCAASTEDRLRAALPHRGVQSQWSLELVSSGQAVLSLASEHDPCSVAAAPRRGIAGSNLYALPLTAVAGSPAGG